MNGRLTLYTRRDCCLCEEMKTAIRTVAKEFPLEFDEIDVDREPALAEKFGAQVPVLFIDGRKVFKYRVTVEALRKKLRG